MSLIRVPGTTLDTVAAPQRRLDSNAAVVVSGLRAGGALHAEVWGMPNGVQIIVSREPKGRNGEYLWHMSVSHSQRYPTWDEIKTARYALLPADICCAMFLPQPEFYVDLPTITPSKVFHVYEVDDERKQWESG